MLRGIAVALLALFLGSAAYAQDKPNDAPNVQLHVAPYPVMCMTADDWATAQKDVDLFPLWAGISEIDGAVFTLAESAENGNWVITIVDTKTGVVCFIGTGERHELVGEEADAG